MRGATVREARGRKMPSQPESPCTRTIGGDPITRPDLSQARSPQSWRASGESPLPLGMTDIAPTDVSQGRWTDSLACGIVLLVRMTAS